MTILAGDIKLLASDTMSDADEGGGAVTGQVIVNGESNNIFQDISTLDRVYGAVHMRKVFAAIKTQTQDIYFGSHVIISKLPGDKKIGVNLFNTKDWFDRRPEAQSRVENYLAQGGVYSGILWATQYQGSRVVTIYQSVSAQIPSISDVIILKSSTQEQYIRITRMDESVQEFTDNHGTYTRRVLELEISDVLENDFTGADMSRSDSVPVGASIFNTVVANAARYYSAQPLALAASSGDLQVKAASVYSQIVPSAQSETAIIDSNAAGATVPVIESSQSAVIFTIANNLTVNSKLYIGSAFLPGSLTIAVSGDTLVDVSGQLENGAGTVIGTVSYADGVCSFGSTSPLYSGTKTITFTPAAAPQRLADTASIGVTSGNRGYVWTLNINPAPKPTTLRVAFRALNKWYELSDNGGGGLTASDSAIGSGTVNYITGSVAITLGALPDVDSEIIFNWGGQSGYINRSDLTPPPLVIEHYLLNSVDPSTLVLTWNDGTARTVNCDVNGDFSGDGTGTFNAGDGKIELIPNIVPPQNTQIAINYSSGALISKVISTFGNTGTSVSVDLGETSITPGSVTISWSALASRPFQPFWAHSPTSHSEIIKDDGLGNLISITTGANVGTLNYSTGIAAFESSFQIEEQYYDYYAQYYDYSWRYFMEDDILVDLLMTNLPLSFVVRLKTAADSVQPEETLTLTALKIDLTTGFDEIIVPGSLLFSFAGSSYVDRLGQLYSDIDRETGAGTYAGTFDYSTALVNLTVWAGGGANTTAIQSMLSDTSYHPVDQVVFRVPVAPVKVSSFSLRCVPADGGSQISVTSAADGTITSADMDGHIEYETGVVNIRFGAWVVAAGNEAEWWYSASAIDGNGNIFKPRHVFADTIFFNAVSISYIPLSAEILGLNPVRLPPDGRIPVYAPGDVVVVLHDQITSGTFTNGTQTDLGRGRIAKLSVKDSAGQLIDVSTYSANLDTGIVDWIDLTGVSQPVSITDRIEDMAVVTDVQITGEITLSQPLTHDFPIDETLISNAIVYGDLYAHTSIPFDQQTWTNVWSDERIGSDTVFQYNHSQYPIIVDNASCINERWAFIFTSSTAFNLVGEHVGQIASGSIASDFSPINPNTNAPFMTVPAAGWGSGQSAGNVLRVNTLAANVPTWIIQAISQGEATSEDFNFCLEVRGDIDTVV